MEKEKELEKEGENARIKKDKNCFNITNIIMNDSRGK